MLTLAPGKWFAGRFELIRELGRGAHSRVWLAEDRREHGFGTVALKILSPQWYDAASKREAAERLRAEGRLLFDLQHPSIVSILDIVVGPTGPTLVLQYVEGGSLVRNMHRRALRGHGYTLHEVEWIVRQLAGALYIAHRRGVVHRDVKPGNVIWREGRVLLLDFGVAKFLETGASYETTEGRSLGSPFYMSPEQALGERVDESTDIFSLGCIVFELLTMHRAWALDELGHRAPVGVSLGYSAINAPHRIVRRLRYYARPAPSAYRPELAPEVDRVIARATAPRPERRYESVLDFSTALIRALHVSEPLADTVLIPTRDPIDTAVTKEVLVPAG